MACCEKVNAVVIHHVDEAMFMVDPARPAAGQLSPEPLGLSRSVGWIPNGRVDESEHAERQPAVGSRPVFEVLEAMTVENDLASPRHSRLVEPDTCTEISETGRLSTSFSRTRRRLAQPSRVLR